ncbi:MAG: GcrA cell cycle regulator [Nitrobacter vulgaris]|jgi:hypothetical protein|nr:GcrA cell cycle regulator [Nitrobacter vulgaris]
MYGAHSTGSDPARGQDEIKPNTQGAAKAADAWTEERLARLVELKDLRQRDIWEELKRLPGPPLSRNAVSGRYYRTFGSKRPKVLMTEAERVVAREACRQKQKERKRERRSDATRLGIGVGAQVQAINRRPRTKPESAPHAAKPSRGTTTFSDLRIFSSVDSNQCRFIEGDTAPALYCGAGTRPGQPYCAHHHKVAHGRQITITEADRARRKAHGARVWFGASVKLVGNPAEASCR